MYCILKGLVTSSCTGKCSAGHYCPEGSTTDSESNTESNDDNISGGDKELSKACLLYTSPSPRDQRGSRMPSSA